MTAVHGDLSQRSGSSDEPSSPTGRQTGSAPSKKRAARTGRRLFAFDRSLARPSKTPPAGPPRPLFPCARPPPRRYVAGADEAGRGSLAGPLVAAAVLFDYERLTLREVRSLTRLDDSKVHDGETRETLYPLVIKAAVHVSITSRCVRGI